MTHKGWTIIRTGGTWKIEHPYWMSYTKIPSLAEAEALIDLIEPSEVA